MSGLWIAFEPRDLAVEMRELKRDWPESIAHAVKAAGVVVPPSLGARTTPAALYHLELLEFHRAKQEYERLLAFACPACGSDRKAPGLRVWRCAACGMDEITWELRGMARREGFGL